MIKTLSASTAAAAIAALLLVVAAPTDAFAADRCFPVLACSP
jgi:hypothetical protein